MKITLDEFEAFFNGGLTQARRDELFVAIFTNSECMQLASAFLLRDELNSLSACEEEATLPVEPAPTAGKKIWSFVKAAGAFISHSGPCGMYPTGIDINGRIKAFRRSLEKANAGSRERDALLVKRVVETCYTNGRTIIHDSTIDEILRLVEPVVKFWSIRFDKGMFLPGTTRSCAHRLLYKPTMSLYKNYKPSCGSFVTYFDTALCNELKTEWQKEIRQTFHGKRVENYEASPKDSELQYDGEGAVEVRMLQFDGKILAARIEKMLPPEEWTIFSNRFMYCKKLKEIAQECNCSMSRVSRISDSVMEKVRKLLVTRSI